MKKIFVLMSLIFVACSSTPTSNAPEWTHQPARNVDNGYIVYTAMSTVPNADRAQFKAEGLALEDLANECSMVPKGTRVENRYIEQGKYGQTAYVQVAVEFQECDLTQKAVDPQEIKRLANVAFTQQLKRYQDFDETGDVADKDEESQIEPLPEMAPAPVRDPRWSESMHFYVVRQYVAYQKEVVVLSPPAAYPPNSLQTKQFVNTVQPAVTQIQETQVQHPELKQHPEAWSHLTDRPKLPRPANLSAKNSLHPHADRSVHAPLNPHDRAVRPPHERGVGGRHGGGKKHRKYGEPMPEAGPEK